MVILLIIILIINLLGYLLISYDKNQARRGRWRTPEKRVFIIAFLGGAIGVFVGMHRHRHKTRKLRFTLGIPVIISINLLCYYVLFLQLN